MACVMIPISGSAGAVGDGVKYISDDASAFADAAKYAAAQAKTVGRSAIVVESDELPISLTLVVNPEDPTYGDAVIGAGNFYGDYLISPGSFPVGSQVIFRQDNSSSGRRALLVKVA